jgi:gliding motility-associated-like protein
MDTPLLVAENSKSEEMLYRIFPFTILLFGALNLLAQTPQSIKIEPGIPGNGQAEMACADQYAGTVSLVDINGNPITEDTIYLCFNEEMNVVHNGDANLTGDPNPGTTAGITYGFFNCQPTISGPGLATILTDPCILNTPPPAQGIWVSAGGGFNGNITFNNAGTLQNFFNGGDPLLIWFAPITIDDFANKQYEVGTGGVTGPCVNANTAAAFPVVYLNEIETSNLSTNTGVSGCQGTFGVIGGLPQFDSSFYNISIALIGNPSVSGQVINGPYTHGETVTFQVPVPGIYTINVTGGQGCVASQLLANMSTCVSVTQSIQPAVAAPGDNICINVTNDAGFIDIAGIQYALTWDPAVLQFTNVTNLTPLLPGFAPASSFNSLGDSLIFSWANSGIGVNLPDGTVLFQVCFDVVGNDGDCTNVEFVDPPAGPGIEVFNGNLVFIGFNGIGGSVCVDDFALVVNSVQDSVSCSGASDGSFTIDIFGGTPPYQVTWQNAGGGPVFGPTPINVAPYTYTANNLSAGTYNITVMDAAGTPLIATEQVTVLGPPVLGLIFNENPPLCNGGTGSIASVVILDSVVVSNPELLYSFEWNTTDTTPAIINIASGLYTLTATEISTGCSITENTFLPQPSPFDVSITIDSSTCSGIGDGAIQVVVAGATPNSNGDYVIQWPTIGPAPGLTIVNTLSNINGLPAEVYPLWVTDDNGCFFEADIALPAKKVLTMNALLDNINCTSACSGSIFIAGSTSGEPAALPYNFDWFGTPPPPPPSGTTQTTTTLTGLCVGTYSVFMEDATGCQIDTTFTISEPPPLVASVLDAQNESCSPGMDGSITIGVTGGTYPYIYTWNTPATDSIVTGLSAGTYTVIVSDSFSCFDTVSATLTAPAPPVIQSLENDTLNCPNSTDGTLTVAAVPGNAPIDVIGWSNSANGATISNLSAGTYYVTVTDEDNCMTTDSAEVVAPQPLAEDSIVYTLPQCPGLGGGSIAAFVSGGTGPYYFEWSNGVTGTGFNVLGSISAGDYSVTITDFNFCDPLVLNLTLNDPPNILVSFSLIDSVSCAITGMTCDGTAMATAVYSDGTGGLFDFTWQSTESDNDVVSSTAVQLCAGAQQVLVSDGLCFDTFSVDIPSPSPITPGATIGNVSCNGLSDGTITLTTSGGTPPYTVTWPGGVTGTTISGLSAGFYIATIVDSKNCNFTHTIAIDEPDPMVVSINAAGTMDVSCAGEEDGLMTVQAQGGNLNLGNAVYLWQNGVSLPSSNFAAGLAAGTYSVTVVDPKGCQDSVSTTISEPAPIQFSLGETLPIQCAGGNTFITVDSVWGGNFTTYQFSVDNGILRLLGSASPVFAGQHTISIVDVLNGCSTDTSITVAEPLELGVELPEVIVVELGDSTTMLDPIIFSSLPIDSFLWTPGEQLSCDNCKNPTVNPIQSQLYTLTITDVNGCTAFGQVLIDLDKNRNVYIPNVFSPNDDGINDKFRIFTGIGVTNINFFRIYDRWGELVFDESNLGPSPDGTIGWDGRFRGQRMQPAVFMYLVEVGFLDGRVLLYRGDVTLLR